MRYHLLTEMQRAKIGFQNATTPIDYPETIDDYLIA